MTTTSSSSVIQPSSSSRLPSGKHKLKRQCSNLVDIPTFDLKAFDDDSDEDSNFQQLSNATYIDYIDHGDQLFICGVCKARLWKAETKRGKKKPNNSYSLCCSGGIVQLPDLKEAPPALLHLFRSNNPKSKHFISNIRRYNSMFAFTSLGGKVDKSINTGRGPYVFRLGGQNFHRLGTLVPSPGSTPKFSQLYIYDTENEITNRQTSCGQSDKENETASKALDMEIIPELKLILDSNNALVKMYRFVRDWFHENPQAEYKLRLIGRRTQDGRTYNLPTVSEVAALIVGDLADSLDNRDIIVQQSSRYLQRINELHPSYLPLQYPILFPYGDDGYRVDILHRGLISATDSKCPNCTMREFFAFRVQDRDDNFSLITNSRRLFQQFLVDGYTMIESQRLYFIRNHQKILRSDTYQNLREVQFQGNTSLSDIGLCMIVPSSFTGGARYMQQNYLDAMSLCRWFGYPDFFITFTCNPKWPEIKRYLKDKNLKPEDRPDILTRIFKIKLDSLLKDLKDKCLDIGEGNVGGSNDGEATLEIPDDLLINDTAYPITSLIDFVYPSILQHYKDYNYFQERAILAPKNEVVHEINERLLSLFPGNEHEYLSSDSLDESEFLHNQFDQHLYSPDVLNGINLSGLPKHRLVLKVGVPVMLLRNIDQKKGLCKGTTLLIKSLGKRVIEAIVLTGSNVGHRTLICRWSLTPTDKKVPFKFNRRQFPLAVCFAMTINKSQGQSLSKVGLYLKEPVFTHGQLYVALSRVTTRDGLKILILNNDGTLTNKTINVVYKEVLDRLD